MSHEIAGSRQRIVLSERLLMSAEMVTKGSRVADVGCDHAHTGIWLIKNEIAVKVIAMDVRYGPLEKAGENIRLYGLEGIIETRLSDGLEKLEEGEVDSIVIAGMGGVLTVEILNKGLKKAAAARELILQPQSDIGLVRRFLRENGFGITQEKMCIEDGKFYNSLRAIPGKNTGCDAGYPSEDVYDEYGEILLRSKDPVLKELLSIHKTKNERNLKSIEASKNATKKKEELIREHQLIEHAMSFYE